MVFAVAKLAWYLAVPSGLRDLDKGYLISSGMEYFMRLSIDKVTGYFEGEDFPAIFGFTILLDYLAYVNTLKKTDKTAKSVEIMTFWKDDKLQKYASATLMRNCGYGSVLQNWNSVIDADGQKMVADILKNGKVKATDEVMAHLTNGTYK